MPPPKLIFKRFVLYPLQAVAALVLYGLFRVLPVAAASAIGGAIGRGLGPLLPVSGRARQNLQTVFPEKTDAEIVQIINDMWDNLGRTAAEYPHVARLDTLDPGGRVIVERGDIYETLRDRNGPCIIFSGHFANWELLPASAAQRGLSSVLVYRAANNPLVSWLYRRRAGHDEASIAPKGRTGARMLFRAMKQGRALGLLVDQKMNDGIAVPFLGRDAMTAPALAELALRYDCPVVPVHIVRMKGATFRVIVEEPLEISVSGDRKKDIRALMLQVNQRIEQWVLDHPAQWLWLHNRWPK